MSEPQLLAITGNPVLHSMSPLIFNRLFRELGINAHYIRLAAGNAEEAMEIAKVMQIRGLNITSPFKEDMYRSLNRVDPHAEQIGAVNCMQKEKNTYTGYNTDYIGVVNALKMNNTDPVNLRIAVLGAGGAARSAVYGLIRARAGRITLLNRTEEKAKNISSTLGCAYAPVSNAKEVLEECDILISCLPRKCRIFESGLLKKTQVVMDANYNGSALIEDAKAAGCRIISGLDWLIHQALPSFKVFTQKEIPENLAAKTVNDLRRKQAAKKNNIAVIGFMGSGKTTVGSLLAEKMGYHFIDTDSLIHKKAGISISEIINSWGEASFRGLERAVIQKCITKDSHGYVFSLGGGTVLNPQSTRIIKNCCYVIWLWASGQTIQKRIRTAARPLLPGISSLEAVEQMLQKRIPCYAQASEFVISNDLYDAHTIATRIKHEMDQTLRN